MIVSTWQFLQKQVRCGSLGRVAKGVNHGKDPAQITFSESLSFNVIRLFRGRSLFVVEIADAALWLGWLFPSMDKPVRVRPDPDWQKIYCILKKKFNGGAVAHGSLYENTFIAIQARSR